MMRRILKTRRSAGFTITELMVALTLTAIVVAATWRGVVINQAVTDTAVGVSVSTERLLFAAEQIAEDATNAAFMGTPSSDVDPFIAPKPPGLSLYGIHIDETVVGQDNYWGSTNLNINPDQLLFQVPLTETIFNPNSINPGGIVDLSTDPNALAMDEDEFMNTFDPAGGDGRLVRIRPPTGFSQLFTVQNAVWSAAGNRRIDLDQAPVFGGGIGTPGLTGTGGDDHEISVLVYVRYRIIIDPRDSTRTLLVREELDPLSNPTDLVAERTFIVAENVVDLQGWVDGVDVLGVYQSDSVGASTTVGSLNPPIDASIHRGRVLHFQISARTDREFDHIAHTTRPLVTNGVGLLRTFDSDEQTASGPAAVNNVAMVQTLARQVELTNFAISNLFP